MRKPVYAIYEQQRRRSACASAQSDQRLSCSLPGEYNTSTWYSQNFKSLASLCSWAGWWFESNLVGTRRQVFLVTWLKCFVCFMIFKVTKHQSHQLTYMYSHCSWASLDLLSHSELLGQFRESDAGFHDDVIGNQANTITRLNDSEITAKNATLNFLERKVSWRFVVV